MSVDIRAVRRAVLIQLAADQPLAALVGASIYGQAVDSPEWPFVKLGSPSAVPRRAACLNGADIRMDLHAFAKPRMADGQEVETAEDHASRITTATQAAITDRTLPLEGGGEARVLWSSWQLLVDGGEVDAFHGIVTLRLRVSA